MAQSLEPRSFVFKSSLHCYIMMEYYQLADWSKVMGSVRRETFFATGFLAVSWDKRGSVQKSISVRRAFAYSSRCQITFCQGHSFPPTLFLPSHFTSNWLCRGFKADIGHHLPLRATGLVKVIEFCSSCLHLQLPERDATSATSLFSENLCIIIAVVIL